MSIKSKYPALRPSLLLDFANSRSVDPRITFTRESTATYFDAQGLMRTAASGVPRIDHYPATGACKGLLIEESRTNLLRYSDQIENAAWAKGSNTIFATEGTSPINGVSPYYSMRSNGTAGNLAISMTFTAPTSGDCALTAWVMTNDATLAASAMRLMSLNVGGDTTRYITFAEAGLTVGQLKRVAFKFSAPADATVAFHFGFDFSTDTNAKLYFCHPQVEAGSFPTSYIPTAGAAVTRAADVAVMTGSNFSSWYRQDEGTLIIERADAAFNTTTIPSKFTISDDAGTNRVDLRQGTVIAGVDMFVVNNGTTVVDTGSLAITKDVSYKAALAFKKDDFALVLNGSTAITDTLGDLGAMTRMRLSSDVCSTYERITYYPKRLSNAKLQALTTP